MSSTRDADRAELPSELPRSCGVENDAPIQQVRLDAQRADVVDVPDGVLRTAPHDGLRVEAGALVDAHAVSVWPIGRRA